MRLKRPRVECGYAYGFIHSWIYPRPPTPSSWAPRAHVDAHLLISGNQVIQPASVVSCSLTVQSLLIVIDDSCSKARQEHTCAMNHDHGHVGYAAASTSTFLSGTWKRRHGQGHAHRNLKGRALHKALPDPLPAYVGGGGAGRFMTTRLGARPLSTA